MMKKIFFTFYSFSSFLLCFGQSDNPCGAPTLTPGSTCAYTSADILTSATASTGVPAPGCASYNGQDVWFQVTVPATGTLTLELNNGIGLTDMGMAWYTGNCSNLLFSQCDDDSGPGLMPMITQTGLTPGTIIFVRIWEFGGNATGSFSICSFAPTPPPPCLGGSNNSCGNADPFCTGATVTYCNSTGVTSMGSYACLVSTPNPMWLYMEISIPGSLDYTISQTTNTGDPIDVDFALYGPYTSIPNACSNIGPTTPTVDCSFSGAAIETVNITNALTGQIYMMLVTNFSGTSGSIDINQTSGNGFTNCSVIQPCSVTATAISDTCLTGVGSVSVSVNQGTTPFTCDWTTLGNQTSETITGVTAGSHSVTVTMNDGCIAFSDVIVPNFTSTYTSSSTPVSCSGGNNGSATATMTPVIGTVTYLWSDGQTTQTASDLSAGTYSCTITSNSGCSGIITATISEIPSMIISIANQTDVTCNSGSDGAALLNVTQGTNPYSYDWDISNSTTSSATNLDAATHTVIVTDANDCEQTVQIIIDEPAPLSITFITPDSMICPSTIINLNANGSGGSSSYIFTWSQGGNTVGTGSSFDLEPNSSGLQYCVTLSEQCGSPTTEECLVITFPTEIIPNVAPDKPKDCIPGEFTFTNTSTNSSEIAFTQYAFSNGDVYNLIGTENLTTDFSNVGVYDVQISVTSNYGCVYSTNEDNIVEVTPIPTANFTVSKNPATWFETTLQTSDISEGNIVDWNWTSPGATAISNGSASSIITYPEGQEGIYPITLIVTTGEGCSDSITLEIQIVPDILLYVPNTFTPDNDEHNQNWFISVDGIDFENFYLVLYNRWGEIVWESRDPKTSWDGTYNGRIVPNGTYIWKITYKEKDNDGKKFHTGSINVLR